MSLSGVVFMALVKVFIGFGVFFFFFVVFYKRSQEWSLCHSVSVQSRGFVASGEVLFRSCR